MRWDTEFEVSDVSYRVTTSVHCFIKPHFAIFKERPRVAELLELRKQEFPEK